MDTPWDNCDGIFEHESGRRIDTEIVPRKDVQVSYELGTNHVSGVKMNFNPFNGQTVDRNDLIKNYIFLLNKAVTDIGKKSEYTVKTGCFQGMSRDSYNENVICGWKKEIKCPCRAVSGNEVTACKGELNAYRLPQVILIRARKAMLTEGENVWFSHFQVTLEPSEKGVAPSNFCSRNIGNMWDELQPISLLGPRQGGQEAMAPAVVSISCAFAPHNFKFFSNAKNM